MGDWIAVFTATKLEAVMFYGPFKSQQEAEDWVNTQVTDRSKVHVVTRPLYAPE